MDEANSVFTLRDLQVIMKEAKDEYVWHNGPVQFDGMERPLTHAEFRVYCIAFGAMRWMHYKGLIKDGHQVIFKTVRPDSTPEVEDADWMEYDPEGQP